MSEGFFVRLPLIHAIGAFCQYFSPISGVRLIHMCDLYTRATYTQVDMVLEELHVTKRLF